MFCNTPAGMEVSFRTDGRMVERQTDVEVEIVIQMESFGILWKPMEQFETIWSASEWRLRNPLEVLGWPRTRVFRIF